MVEELGRKLMAAGLIGASAGLALAGHALGAGVVGVMLYNRLSRNTTFDNDTRRKIFDYVKTMPGSCIADIAGQAGVSHSTASYHLDKLLAFSLLTSTIDGNKVRFFINGGAFSEEERRTLAALDNGETRRVLAEILKHPWCYRAELTGILGVSSPTVNWHLERLQEAGLVQENRSGRNRFLFADKNRIVGLLSTLLRKLQDTGYDRRPLEDLTALAESVP